MSDPDAETRREEVLSWMDAAEDDRRTVELCLAATPPLRTVAAFHCQQAAEKLLKGFLVHAAVRFRKTHDLGELGAAVVQAFPNAQPFVAPVKGWTAWNAAFRYPADLPPPPAEELQRACAAIAALAAQLRALARAG
jgi:HEPN domain-containing protein